MHLLSCIILMFEFRFSLLVYKCIINNVLSFLYIVMFLLDIFFLLIKNTTDSFSRIFHVFFRVKRQYLLTYAGSEERRAWFINPTVIPPLFLDLRASIDQKWSVYLAKSHNSAYRLRLWKLEKRCCHRN